MGILRSSFRGTQLESSKAAIGTVQGLSGVSKVIGGIGRLLKRAAKEGTEESIHRAIRAQIAQNLRNGNWYSAYKKALKKAGMSRTHQVHHIIAQQFFKDPSLGKWLSGLGFEKNGARNLVALPTKKGIKERATRAAQAAMHDGGHVSKYFDDIEEELLQIRERHAVGELSQEAARAEVNALRSATRQGLLDGSIKLHNVDTPGYRASLQKSVMAIMVIGMSAGMSQAEASDLAMTKLDQALDNERYYRDKNTFARYGVADYYVRNSDSRVAKWGAFAIDFFNPVEDIVFFSDTAVDIAQMDPETPTRVFDQTSYGLMKWMTYWGQQTPEEEARMNYLNSPAKSWLNRQPKAPRAPGLFGR